MKIRFWMVITAVLIMCGPAAPVLHAGSNKPVVLFDQGHKQIFVIEQDGGLHLSSLANLFREAGYEVKTSSQPVTSELLTGVTAFVISGPFSSFTADESRATKRFIENGGRLAVMLHIAPTVLNLLQECGIDTTNGSVHEVENLLDTGDKDFSVTRLEPHPITKGLGRFSVHGMWGLEPRDRSAKTIAKTSLKAWVDHNKDGKFTSGDAAGEFGVIITGSIGKGEFAVFGDDAIFQNKFLKDENYQLGKNLVYWMLEKHKE